jgi:hypothetical protein
MEHIVQSLGQKSDISGYIEQGYEDDAEDLEDIAEEGNRDEVAEDSKAYDSRASSRAYKRNNKPEADDVSSDMEDRLYKNPARNSKRFSTMSIVDVADRHLRDKTNDIADIIRNISAQCAAAVEGLQLAHDAEVEAEEYAHDQLLKGHRQSNLSTITASDDGHSALGSETGDDSLLHPSGRASSIPPTPDLIHNRSSTAMSIASTTTTPERSSQQYMVNTEIPTKIVEDDDEEMLGRSDSETMHHETGIVSKNHDSLLHRPAGARISALGGH